MFKPRNSYFWFTDKLAMSAPKCVADSNRTEGTSEASPDADIVDRVLSVKALNVGAGQGGIASRCGRDADCVDFVRHSAIQAFSHIHHHRGNRLAYPATPQKRERAFLAPLNVLLSRHCR
jgi:hypothetical protein